MTIKLCQALEIICGSPFASTSKHQANALCLTPVASTFGQFGFGLQMGSSKSSPKLHLSRCGKNTVDANRGGAAPLPLLVMGTVSLSNASKVLPDCVATCQSDTGLMRPGRFMLLAALDSFHNSSTAKLDKCDLAKWPMSSARSLGNSSDHSHSNMRSMVSLQKTCFGTKQ